MGKVKEEFLNNIEWGQDEEVFVYEKKSKKLGEKFAQRRKVRIIKR